MLSTTLLPFYSIILFAVVHLPLSAGFVFVPSSSSPAKCFTKNRHASLSSSSDSATSSATTAEFISEEEEEEDVLSTNHGDYDPSVELIRLLEETSPSKLKRQQQHLSEKQASEKKKKVESETIALQESTTTTTTDSIIRDLDGKPLTKEYFAEKMGVPLEDVESYTCPEEDAFRGFMSTACRVHLIPPSASDNGGDNGSARKATTKTKTKTTTNTAFYKHVVFETLHHAKEKSKTAPHKLVRDAHSYKVVASFLSSKACRRMTEETGVKIPLCLDAQLRPDYDDPMKSKFSFLFEDLSAKDGWYQKWLLDDIDSCHAALTTFAKLHAYFWTGSNFWKAQKGQEERRTKGNNEKDGATRISASIQEEFVNSVWESGSYVQPAAQGFCQWKDVASEWKKKRMKFVDELSSHSFWDTLGDRLQSVAEECGRVAHPFATTSTKTDAATTKNENKSSYPAISEIYKRYRTFTHGDPKQANLLFRRSRCDLITNTNISSKDDENLAKSFKEEDYDESKKLLLLEVGLIDFQWAGFGLAATDVAHFMTSAVHADQLIDGGEERLMKYYYDELQNYLIEYGVYESSSDVSDKYGYETFVDQYEIGVLDICRLMIAYTWSRFTEPVEKDNDHAAQARTMNKTSYNKSIPNIVWLLSRCDEILKSKGV